MSANSIVQNWKEFQERLSVVCEKAGRKKSEIQVVVASKTQNAERIQELCDLGQFCFGESRLQEAEEKLPLLPSFLNWHFIGRLQKNKIRKIITLFDFLHSVDSLETLASVNRISGEEGKTPKILLQVNIEKESTKGGFSPLEISQIGSELSKFQNVQIAGLMCLPPFSNSEKILRGYFSSLRNLRENISHEVDFSLPELSMGMSHDFEYAVLEGATLIRPGSLIFGQRK